VEESEQEYEAVKTMAKAEKRYRVVLYIVTGFFFAFTAFQLLAIRNDINVKVDSLQRDAKSLVDLAIREGQTRDKEETRYITCIFLFPIETRTQEVKENCFKISDLPGGLEREDFSPSFSDTSTGVEQGVESSQ
jgi:hypothetical protein